jgi:hypothetical protein
MVGTVVSDIIEGSIDGYFYDKKVDKLRDAVDKIMENAHQRAHALMSDGFSGLTIQQVDFFNNIDLSLQNIRNIYREEMDQTVEKIDKKAQTILATVDRIVHAWSKELINPQMQQLAYEAKATFNSLPFVKGRPVLSAFFPVFVAPSKRQSDILIKCVGNFPSLPESKDKPTLHFKGREYTSSGNQPHIEFSIPLFDLFPKAGNSNHGIRRASFDVKIPYASESLSSFLWPSQRTSEYQGSIYLLPEFPGKITIHYTKMKDQAESDTITSDEYIQNSRSFGVGGEGRTFTKLYTLQTRPGWKIVPESVRFNVISSKGNREQSSTFKNRWELHQANFDQFSYMVTTHKYAPKNHCGKIRFKLSATISRPIPIKENTHEEHWLKWGESRVIDESKGSWVVHFESFDGIRNEVPGYGISRFFKVQPFGGRPVLSIDPPERVTSHFLLSGDHAASARG